MNYKAGSGNRFASVGHWRNPPLAFCLPFPFRLFGSLSHFAGEACLIFTFARARGPSVPRTATRSPCSRSPNIGVRSTPLRVGGGSLGAPPILPACFGQPVLADTPQARMGGAPRMNVGAPLRAVL